MKATNNNIDTLFMEIFVELLTIYLSAGAGHFSCFCVIVPFCTAARCIPS